MKFKSFFARIRLLFLGLVMGGFASGALAGGQDFTLVNDTGVEIHAVYVSPSKVNDWEEDLLDGDTLADGESLDISFERSETAAKWDLKVEDHKGNSITWNNLNLLKISKLTLHYKNGKAWADAQ